MNPNTIEFWLDFYTNKETKNNFLTYDRFEYAKKIVDMFEIKGDVCDVGCGTGAFLSLIDGNKYGFDFSRTAIENNICTDAILEVASAYEGIPFNKKFDFITIIQTLEHMDFPDLIIEACIPNLKPNGKLVISVPNIVEGEDQYIYHVNSWNQNTMNDFLSKYGLESIFNTDEETLYSCSWRTND